MVVAAVAGVVMMVAGAARYQRSSATLSYAEGIMPLLRSEREYCLILRAFGRDGEIIVPATTARGRTVDLWGFRENVTVEQLVARAAGDALGVDAYGIVDQSVAFAPPGVRFIRASNDEWKRVAQRLIRRAHSIVLIVAAGHDVRDGLAWEIDQVVRYRRRSRVILVLPPPQPDHRGHERAHRQAAVLLAMLAAPASAADARASLSGETLIAKCETIGIREWGLLPDDPRQRKAVVSDASYLPGLVEAFQCIERELSTRSFHRRYA